jgi:hypothetical protein
MLTWVEYISLEAITLLISLFVNLLTLRESTPLLRLVTLAFPPQQDSHQDPVPVSFMPIPGIYIKAYTSTANKGEGHGQFTGFLNMMASQNHMKVEYEQWVSRTIDQRICDTEAPV